MWYYILKRILAAIPVMVVVAIVVFVITRIAGGDPAAVMAGEQANVAQVEAIRERLGLNRTVFEQFIIWVSGLLRGDFGESPFYGMKVTHLILQRLEPSLLLTVMTMALAMAVAIPLGVLAAWRAGSAVDRLVMALAVTGFSVPVFVIGYALIYLFSVRLGWLPVQGYVPLADNPLLTVRSLVLPAVSLGLVYVALIARVTRASLIETLSQDYVRTAWAKGLNTQAVLLVHALKNAAIPIATVIGVGFALIISGVVVTETVFNIPGLGRLTVDAIARRDYAVIQAMIMLFSGVYVLINVVIDILYTLFDPRIRY